MKLVIMKGCVDENTPTNPLSMYGIAKNALRQSFFIDWQEKIKYGL